MLSISVTNKTNEKRKAEITITSQSKNFHCPKTSFWTMLDPGDTNQILLIQKIEPEKPWGDFEVDVISRTKNAPLPERNADIKIRVE